MDIFATISNYNYTHGGGLKKALEDLEMMISFVMGNQEKAAPYLEKYEALIRQHGARTPQSIAVLEAIASEENRDIITTGNLLHLGNVIQPCTVSAPCTEDDDMGRKNITYMHEGKKYSATGETFAEAVENAVKRHCEAPAQPESNAPLFEPYAEKFFERKARKDWKDGTIRNNRTLLNKHLLPFFGEMKIDEITLGVVQFFFDLKMDDPDPRGKSQSNLEKMQLLLGQVMDEAVEDEIIKKNPAKSKRLVVKGIPEQERKHLTEQQAAHVAEQLSTLLLQEQLLIALPLFTGMRRGEFLGRTWEKHIDLEHRMVFVEEGTNVRFKGNQPFLTTLKSKSAHRYITISDPLYNILMQCPNKHGYVIGESSKPITESTYDRAWARIARKIELYGATAHPLRHTFGTLLDGVVSSLELKYIMGHEDVQTTDIYVHKGQETTQRTQGAINDRFVQLYFPNSHEISHGQKAASA